MRAATLIWTAQTVAVSGTLLVVVCARLKTCKDNYAFLTEKMEDSFYWWGLLLLLRKLLIVAARMLNTSSPSRGWFLSSLVIDVGSLMIIIAIIIACFLDVGSFLRSWPRHRRLVQICCALGAGS
jgi:hypothetical protein